MTPVVLPVSVYPILYIHCMLTSVKKMLGITEECKDFDPDIIMHINSALMILTQLGVGPEEGFYIEDDSSFWDDFVKDISKLEAIKTYVYMRVRLMFDPPTSSSAMESTKNIMNELEWRLNIAGESLTE